MAVAFGPGRAGTVAFMLRKCSSSQPYIGDMTCPLCGLPFTQPYLSRIKIHLAAFYVLAQIPCAVVDLMTRNPTTHYPLHCPLHSFVNGLLETIHPAHLKGRWTISISISGAVNYQHPSHANHPYFPFYDPSNNDVPQFYLTSINCLFLILPLLLLGQSSTLLRYCSSSSRKPNIGDYTTLYWAIVNDQREGLCWHNCPHIILPLILMTHLLSI
ncbi:hypothetical protein EDB19DRAFT_1743649 [Suillus lakei]|nr:hypothetical protein EDB19DRAFT_1743649 [Suillus lakei]